MKLATIWHMHQPDYRDKNGVMQMPWVFLHSIKDYYDMPWMMNRHKEMRATFNITPPLIEQIKLYYDEPQKYDYFLNLWLQNPNSLSQNQRDWVEKICKSAQFDTMVSPLPHFKTLFLKECLSESEFFDLEILFILSWCGVYLRQNSKVVSCLISKQNSYNLDDKITLLEELKAFIKGIFPYYKALHVEGYISISTTPLNHPILPLLLDMQNAKRANPLTNIPKNHQPLKEDAKLQISKAIELFKETFGFTPKGFWPAEGAVDEKSIELLKSFGIEWIATDEEILFKSLQDKERKNLYSPYSYKGVCIGFRDHGLSDLIGFTYRFKEANSASENFINSLKPIAEELDDSVVFVILDGENAWEFYKNNAFDFFDSLYGKLSKTSWCKTVTMDEVCKGKQKELQTISPGSWINGEFNTWVGHKEKSDAWEMIFTAKKEFEKHKAKLKDETKEQIVKHFLASECSDWFWWYGDDHQTDFGAEFDTLFRSHIIDIYTLLQINPPQKLFHPINKELKPLQIHSTPTSTISPFINGHKNSFFEWLGCGVIDETKLFSTMEGLKTPVKRILYGHDGDFLYFAFDIDKERFFEFETLCIEIEPDSKSAKIPLNKSKGELKEELVLEYVYGDFFEFKIKKRDFSQKEVELHFELCRDDTALYTLPSFGKLKIDLDDDYSKNWFI